MIYIYIYIYIFTIYMLLLYAGHSQVGIGVDITAFCAPFCLPTFQLKCRAFFACFTLIVQCIYLYYFVSFPVLNLKLCLHGRRLSRVILARAKSMECLHGVLLYQLCTVAVTKNTRRRFSVHFSVFFYQLFRSLKLMPMGRSLGLSECMTN